MDIEEVEDIRVENLKKAIEEYLQNIQTVDVSRFLAENRIVPYKNINEPISFLVCETDEAIETLIKQVWGEELTKQREGNVEYYRFALQEIICSYVSERHADGERGVKIPFFVFQEVLDKVMEMTEETRLLFYKDILFSSKREYCEDNCVRKNECEACDLHRKISWLESLSNAEIKNAFYMMSPDVNEDISNKAVPLVNNDGLYGSVFPTLKAIEYAETDQAGRIFYEKDKSYLLTDITVSKNASTNKRTYKHLCENKTIENICDEILKNRDFAFARMEIDSLIINNGKEETEIEGIAMLNTDTYNLDGESDGKDKIGKIPSYARITQKKQVSMIDAEKFIKEQKGQENG